MHAPLRTRSLLSRGFVHGGGDEFGGSPDGGDAGDGKSRVVGEYTMLKKGTEKERERESVSE